MQASALAPESPEPLQAQASLLHEQGRPTDEALTMLKRSVRLWFKQESSEVDNATREAARRDPSDAAATTAAANPLEGGAPAVSTARASQNCQQEHSDTVSPRRPHVQLCCAHWCVIVCLSH